MSRTRVLTDEMWARIEPVLPPLKGPMGRPMFDHRRLVEGAIWHYRTGTPWRDLPAQFGPWQTVWKRQHRFATDGTWDKVLAVLLADADAAGLIDWTVAVDSTHARAHQHGTNVTRIDPREAVLTGQASSRGSVESQESARRAS